MPIINREEYQILKELDDKWKWIARDGECNSLNVFSIKPIKVHSQWDYMDVGYKHAGLTKEENKMFQFIQWEDEEPYNIAELIEGYEKNYIGSWQHAIDLSNEMSKESDEMEVKDIDWLKSWFSDDGRFYSGVYIQSKINQLDESEITENQVNDYLEERNLTSIPKGYLMALVDEAGADDQPETVASIIAEATSAVKRLARVLHMEVEELEE